MMLLKIGTIFYRLWGIILSSLLARTKEKHTVQHCANFMKLYLVVLSRWRERMKVAVYLFYYGNNEADKRFTADRDGFFYIKPVSTDITDTWNLTISLQVMGQHKLIHTDEQQKQPHRRASMKFHRTVKLEAHKSKQAASMWTTDH